MAELTVKITFVRSLVVLATPDVLLDTNPLERRIRPIALGHARSHDKPNSIAANISNTSSRLSVWSGAERRSRK